MTDKVLSTSIDYLEREGLTPLFEEASELNIAERLKSGDLSTDDIKIITGSFIIVEDRIIATIEDEDHGWKLIEHVNTCGEYNELLRKLFLHYREPI